MARELIIGNKLAVEYVSHIGTDLTVVNAARISLAKTSDSLTDADRKLIKYLADHKHMSVFEHQTATFIVSCPLYIRSQIHRHRTFSYNEVSRRYTDDGIEFYIPDVFHKQAVMNKQGSVEEFTIEENSEIKGIVEYCQKKMQEMYEKLIEKGVAKEEARCVLPTGLMTKFYMTGNLRNWMQFLAQRLNTHAQLEVRIIAQKVFKELIVMFPLSVGAMMVTMFNEEILAGIRGEILPVNTMENVVESKDNIENK